MNFYLRNLSPKVFGFNIFAMEAEISSFLVQVKTLNLLKIFWSTNHAISLQKTPNTDIVYDSYQ